MQPEVKAPQPAFLELAVSRQHCWTPIMTFYIIPPPAISASQPAWLSPAAAAPLTPCGQHISTQAASRIWNDAGARKAARAASRSSAPRCLPPTPTLLLVQVRWGNCCCAVTPKYFACGHNATPITESLISVHVSA